MDRIDNMFFEFKAAALGGKAFRLSSKSKISFDCNGYFVKYAKELLASLPAEGEEKNIRFSLSVPYDIKKLCNKYTENAEGYFIVIGDDINIYSLSKRGLVFAVSTLKQLTESENLKKGFIYDCPDKALRGYKVYIPGKNNIGLFKSIADMLVYYKYNMIMIEVGGAMEYKKHPEINKKWVEFCEEVHRSPYEAQRIQEKTYPWAKNSIHADNGEGEFISQDQLRELVEYCKERELTVIPEVPSLSHSDYIVMAHPELNERIEDAYPDTYCPSDPKTYEVLFDIIDEVIDVFEPEMMNIGHDECYTLAKCEKCRGKDPVDLYVGDIVKINDYLKSKNIKTLMWGEKVFDMTIHGSPAGGAGDPENDIPQLYECAGKIPKDVLLSNWAWEFCEEKQETEIMNMGYEMIYGNYSAVDHNDYRKRITKISGGYTSNWGSLHREYMQRNYQNFALSSTAFIFWNDEYDDGSREKVIEKVKAELYGRYLKTIGDDYIEITHTTDEKIRHRMFYDGYFIVADEWLFGNYKVTFESGKSAKLPVFYGENIFYDFANASSSEIAEPTGASYPVYQDGKTYYKTAYKNPFPGEKIVNIEFVPEGAHKVDFKSFEQR